jgi:hypothetical protein
MSKPVAATRGLKRSTPDRPAPGSSRTPFDLLDQQTIDFYLRSLRLLDESGVEYLVGGAYGLAFHAGIVRHTKDLDVFVRPPDRDPVLEMFSRNGYRAELTFPHWLGKAFDPNDETTFVDVIYGSGNGLCAVDDDWFTNAVKGEVLGHPARIVPVEEYIWTKAYICERERFDGADINHLLQARGDRVNWRRLLGRFAGHERVLLAHLLMFEFVYPGERSQVPEWVLDQLVQMTRDDRSKSEDDPRLCRGTCLSRGQYLPDIQDRGYLDARVQPYGPMKPADVKHWTDAIGTIK